MRVAFASGLLVAALVASAPAVAADMPLKAAPAPVIAPTWNGTYIGINGGWSVGTSRQSTFPFTATTGDYDIRGGMAGVTYGGNWQSGHVVLGFESDFDWAHINGDPSLPGICAGAVCFTHNRWFSTERMRAGWDFNGWLLYGTLGVAFADVQAGQTTSCVVGLCGQGLRTGWVAGLGVETMFWQNWSAKLEYLHYDLGEKIMYNPGTPITVLDRGDILRAGINYHFDLLGLLGH